MTYEASEESVASGQPVELYHWYSQAGDHYRQTSCGEIITYAGYDWSPTYRISRNAIKLMGVSTRNEVEITTDFDNPAISGFVAAAPEYPVYVTIYRGHGLNFIEYRNLVLNSIRFKQSKDAVVLAEPVTTNLKRARRARISCRLCNVPLYGTFCRVNPTAFQVNGTIDTISTITITSAAFATKADGWFVGGKIFINSLNKQRMILTHVTNTITITEPIVGAIVGNSFGALAGCDHTPTTCKNKFANLDNFWGDVKLPTRELYGQPIAYKRI